MNLAAAHKLEVFAITDHDNLAGSLAAEAYLKDKATAQEGDLPKMLSGVELSCTFEFASNRSMEIHLLGYGFRLDDPSLQSALVRQRQGRYQRFLAMLDRLTDLGMPMEEADIVVGNADAKPNSDHSIGRPHLAQAMVRLGWVQTVEEAFMKYLRNGAPGYVPNRHLSVLEAVDLIHGAGGKILLAHPGIYFDYPGDKMDSILDLGLDGIEVFYPKHSRKQQKAFASLAKRRDLIMSGGSDFHGFFREDRDFACSGLRRKDLDAFLVRAC